jgi:pyruvate dehydrogenase E2 component (dihydrolipoamide acetyltransferase)
MANFVMPKLGADMAEGTLKAWLKKPGDEIKKGDIIAEVLTDKGIIEVEVFTNGHLERILVEPETEVPVGTVLAIIREPGEVVSPMPAIIPQPEQPAAREVLTRLRVSPAARKLAVELNVDLNSIHGTGPGGSITRVDIERAAAEKKTAAPVQQPPDFRERMRMAIAAAMARSKREIPHYYLSTTINMTSATNWLKEENLKRSVTDRLLYGVLLIKAVALALKQYPELNALWKENRAELIQSIHIGVAISLRQGGLIAPAIHDADRKNLTELMQNLNDLVQRARLGGLRSSELTDSTITVTSLGEMGVETVFPIIYPPQVAIVGFGKIAERPCVEQGQVLPRPLIVATLAADHRVSDGHHGARFLAAIDRLLQAPEKL